MDDTTVLIAAVGGTTTALAAAVLTAITVQAVTDHRVEITAAAHDVAEHAAEQARRFAGDVAALWLLLATHLHTPQQRPAAAHHTHRKTTRGDR